MRNKLIKLRSLIIILIFIYVNKTNADTIVLKNGNQIEVDKAWEEGKYIKAKKGESLIGFPKEDVGAVIKDKEDQYDSFDFDIWKAGITVEKAFKLAEINDIPLVIAGGISFGNKFNPKVYKDINNTNVFHYRTILMGKNSDVSLYFTPTSRLLYKIIIDFSGFGANSKEFKDEMLTMLKNKYGDKDRYGFQILGNTRTWSMGNKYKVKLIDRMGYLQLEYADNALGNQNDAEKKKIEDKKREEYTDKDSSKF